MHRAIKLAALLSLLGIMGAACASYKVIKALPDRVTRLEARVKAAEDRQAKLEAQLAQLTDSTGQRIAGAGADLQTLASQVRELRGMIDDLSYKMGQQGGAPAQDISDRIAALENRIATLESLVGAQALSTAEPPSSVARNTQPPPNSAEGDPQTEYKQAYSLLDAGKLDDARVAFQGFLNKYPQNPLSSNAIFWIGECYFRQNEFTKAAQNYARVVKEYPKSSKAADSYYKLGLSFYNLKKYDAAKASLQKVISDYPQSYTAPLARKKLEIIQKEGH